MRVAIAAVGTDSDVLPMLALGKAFQQKGHTVTICVPESYRSLCMQIELRMVTSGAHFQQYLEPETPPPSNKTLAAALANEVPVHFVAMRDTIRDTDVLIGSPLQTAGPSLAEQQRIPYFCAIQTPVHLDRAKFPCWGIMAQQSGLLSSIRLHSRRKAWHNSVLTAINRERAFSHLDPIHDLYGYFFLSGHQLIATDPGMVLMEDSPGRTVTGFWFFDPPEIDSDLKNYLEAGPPPVFVHLPRISDSETRDLCGRLKEHHHRVLIRSIREIALPEGARILDQNASLRVLEYAIAAIHDGNVRIFAASAHAGIPQVIKPELEDQRFWADAVHKSSLGPKPVVESDALFHEVQEALNNSAIKNRTKDIGEKLRASDGSLKAVETVETFLKTT